MKDIAQETLKMFLNYDPDTGVFTWRISVGSSCVGRVAGYKTGTGYIRIRLLGQLYEAHRLAWLYVHGAWPNRYVDHINGNTSDNRISNLRNVTKQENARNRNKPASSGFMGVYRDRNKWRTAITVDKQTRITKGGFATPEEAHAAYLELKAMFHPETVAARKTSK